MNKKLIKKSIYTLTIALPLFTTMAFTYPLHARSCKPYHGYHGGHPMMPPMNHRIPENMPQELIPVYDDNRLLFQAMETGDIKQIQNASKKLISTINKLQDANIKRSLGNATRFLDFMTKSTSYKEMRTAYRTVLQNLSPHGRYRHDDPMPSLYVDSATYQVLQDAELVYKQLEDSLYNGTEATVDARIKALMGLLKNIKTPALSEYVASANTALSNMYNAKNLVLKLEQLRSVRLNVAPLFWITKEKIS